MHTLVSAFCNAVLIGIFLVAFGAAFGRLHPTIDLLGQFVLPALVGAVLAVLRASDRALYDRARRRRSVADESLDRLAVTASAGRRAGERSACEGAAVQRVLQQPTS